MDSTLTNLTAWPPTGSAINISSKPPASKSLTMHEIFLTSQILPEDLSTTLRLLQGYCGMIPLTSIRRRLLFEGPRVRNPQGLDRKFLDTTKSPKRELWMGLSQQMQRQSYVITVVYEVEKEIFGEGSEEGEGPEIDCDQSPGTLRWNDLPDPAGGRPVNSRLMASIENELNLPKILSTYSHTFTKEIIQDTRRFILNNVTFELSRYLQLPSPSDETPSSGSSIRKHLPPFESLTPFDSENKWILTVSALVLDGNDPIMMQKGIDELVAIKADFEGVIDLVAVDRHVLDTRVKF